MSRSTFKVSFYLKKKEIDKEGKVPVMVKLTVNSDKKEFSAKLRVKPELWNAETYGVLGKSADTHTSNTQLNNISNTLNKHYHAFLMQEYKITPELLINAYNGILPNLMPEKEKYYFLKDFRNYLKERETLIGKEIVRATYTKEKNSYNRFEEFIQRKNLSERELNEYLRIKKYEEDNKPVDFKIS